MPVAQVRELFAEEGEQTFSFTPDDSASRSFHVRCTARTDGAAVIYTSGLVPVPGNSHPTLPQLARKCKVKRLGGSPYWWTYDVDYSDAPIKEPQDPNPLNRPAVITADARQYTRATLIDRDGNAIVNSAGDLYDPIEVDDARWNFKVTKNVAYNGVPTFILAANNSINQDTFELSQLGLSFDAETLKVQEMGLSDLKTELIVVGGSFTALIYRAFSFSLSFKQEGWKLKTPSRGLRAVNTGSVPGVASSIPTGSLYYIKVPDKTGASVFASKPKYLQDDGSELFPNGASVDPANIIYDSFNLYDDFDFTALTSFCT